MSIHSPPQIRQKEMLAYSYGIGRSLQLESIEDEIKQGKNSISNRVLSIPIVIKQGKLPSRKVSK